MSAPCSACSTWRPRPSFRRPRSFPRWCGCGRGPRAAWPICGPWRGSPPRPSASAARCCAAPLAVSSPVPSRSWRGWVFPRRPGRRNYQWPISCGLPRLLTSERSLNYGDAMIRSFAFNVFFYIFTLLTAVVGIVLVPIPTPVVLRTLLHWWARAVVWGMRWIGGMKVEIRGRANIPVRGAALLANKHHSESDGVFLAAELPGIAFVAMQELFSYPLIGAILYRLQMIRVDACGGGKE